MCTGKNPQCVLANITQLLFSDMCVSGRAPFCLTSPHPHPQALKPLHKHHRVWPGLFTHLVLDIRMHREQTLQVNGSSVASKSSWRWMLSSVTRTGETVSFEYNQVRSLWLNIGTARESESKPRHSRKVANRPVLCQVK